MIRQPPPPPPPPPAAPVYVEEPEPEPEPESEPAPASQAYPRGEGLCAIVQFDYEASAVRSVGMRQMVR